MSLQCSHHWWAMASNSSACRVCFASLRTSLGSRPFSSCIRAFLRFSRASKRHSRWRKQYNGMDLTVHNPAIYEGSWALEFGKQTGYGVICRTFLSACTLQYFEDCKKIPLQSTESCRERSLIEPWGSCNLVDGAIIALSPAGDQTVARTPSSMLNRTRIV